VFQKKSLDTCDPQVPSKWCKPNENDVYMFNVGFKTLHYALAMRFFVTALPTISHTALDAKPAGCRARRQANSTALLTKLPTELYPTAKPIPHASLRSAASLAQQRRAGMQPAVR